MINALIGTKLNQTQKFLDTGKRIPVTLILSTPCKVVGIKKTIPDGYNAVQLGLGYRRPKTISQPVLGVYRKAGLDKNPPRFLREVYLSDLSNLGDLKIGTEIKIGDVFAPGDTVSVTGISKGKGFAGVVKRHHFKGGPRTHGQSDRERAPGSIGQTTTPGRVYKGKRMAGRMGQDRVTVKNLRVVNIDTEKNILTVSGLIPGGRNGLLMIKKLEA
ncbi:50S ribosomal protein L3 [Candidatus Gottesmanbacteria bacterium RIFCSPLOWO2_01_FULL_39_12b]|uniref:Large ribosomal subunit protein uL3 n=1 Tax=Candidatus Gottesmanbacteria bacterium RIFCSPLOWO2_01_FULL_39_12b TaxID=1798388 RepID=A0A1F6ARK4_9BACT|nr:MAG: 50S ribosomal protein L3 [Candidatus Gottesmanbacteria bacterium RIFCSPLOWO2_01_FULL_39_12b]